MGKLQNWHSDDIVLSTFLVLSIPDSLLNEKLLKYCLGQFLIWFQFAETINSFFWSLFFFGTCLTTATLFLSFNMYFLSNMRLMPFCTKSNSEFSSCNRGTKVSYLPWKFIKFDWFLQMVEPIFLISFSFWQSSQFQPQNHSVLVLTSVCGDNFPNVT